MNQNRIILIIFLISIPFKHNFSQSYDNAGWKILFEKDNLEVSFIFYAKGDNYNNGVVIKISNKGKLDLDYRFILIFRSHSEDKRKLISGSIEAGKILTGSLNNLFFIPFKDGRSINELGITGIQVSNNKT